MKKNCFENNEEITIIYLDFEEKLGIYVEDFLAGRCIFEIDIFKKLFDEAFQKINDLKEESYPIESKYLDKIKKETIERNSILRTNNQFEIKEHDFLSFEEIQERNQLFLDLKTKVMSKEIDLESALEKAREIDSFYGINRNEAFGKTKKYIRDI